MVISLLLIYSPVNSLTNTGCKASFLLCKAVQPTQQNPFRMYCILYIYYYLYIYIQVLKSKSMNPGTLPKGVYHRTVVPPEGISCLVPLWLPQACHLQPQSKPPFGWPALVPGICGKSLENLPMLFSVARSRCDLSAHWF